MRKTKGFLLGLTLLSLIQAPLHATDHIQAFENIFSVTSSDLPECLKSTSNQTQQLKKTMQADAFFQELGSLAEELYQLATDRDEITIRVDYDYDGTHELVINNRVNKLRLKYGIGTDASNIYGDFELKLATFVTSHDGVRKLRRASLHAKSHGNKTITIKLNPLVEIWYKNDGVETTFSEQENGFFTVKNTKLKQHRHTPSHIINKQVKEGIEQIKQARQHGLNQSKNG